MHLVAREGLVYEWLMVQTSGDHHPVMYKTRGKYHGINYELVQDFLYPIVGFAFFSRRNGRDVSSMSFFQMIFF